MWAGTTISQLLATDPLPINDIDHFVKKQLKDPEILAIIRYIDACTLPKDGGNARKLVAQSFSFTLLDGILYFVDAGRENRKRAVVPAQLRMERIIVDHSQDTFWESNYTSP